MCKKFTLHTELVLVENFLPKNQLDALYHELFSTIHWEQYPIKLFGKTHLTPRLSCWMGEPEATYTYSHLTMTPEPWKPSVFAIKKKIEEFSEMTFNSVLLNLYRDGNDSNGWHSDNEKELGKNPCIASFSLGDTRKFKLKHVKTGEQLDIDLKHGDLLLMGKSIQNNWKHALPKTKKDVEPRINLTFRNILSTMNP